MDPSTYLTTGVSALVLLGAAWRGLRGLTHFVDAVTTNTTAVAALAAALDAHISTAHHTPTPEGTPHG